MLGPAGRLLGRLELGDDAGQALGEHVIDLPGHPLPFVARAAPRPEVAQLGLQGRCSPPSSLQAGWLAWASSAIVPLRLVLLLGLGAQQHEQADGRDITGPPTRIETSDTVGRWKRALVRSRKDERHGRAGAPAPGTGQIAKRIRKRPR